MGNLAQSHEEMGEAGEEKERWENAKQQVEELLLDGWANGDFTEELVLRSCFRLISLGLFPKPEFSSFHIGKFLKRNEMCVS